MEDEFKESTKIPLKDVEAEIKVWDCSRGWNLKEAMYQTGSNCTEGREGLEVGVHWQGWMVHVQGKTLTPSGVQLLWC